METLLEFVLARHLGDPRSTRGNGVSYWNCPVCDSSSFHTFPENPDYKHRAKCWDADCGFRGDLADMLAHFYPKEDYAIRLRRITKYELEWRASTEERCDPSLLAGS